jgi:hypothetical protein
MGLFVDILQRIPHFFFCGFLVPFKFFFVIISLIGEVFDCLLTMMHGEHEDQIENQLANELTGELEIEKVKKKARKRGTSRLPGRPHKRLQGDTLATRTDQLRKKLEVLVAKRILISERLESYENEIQIRDAQPVSEAVACE